MRLASEGSVYRCQHSQDLASTNISLAESCSAHGEGTGTLEEFFQESRAEMNNVAEQLQLESARRCEAMANMATCVASEISRVNAEVGLMQQECQAEICAE